MSLGREEQLVARVRAGDQAALGDLLELVQHRLFSLCLGMLGNRDDAAEMAQETMLRIVRHVGDFRSQSSFSTWMIRIAMNLCLTRLRQRRPSLNATAASPWRPAAAPDPPGEGEVSGSGHQARTKPRETADHRELRPDLDVEQREQLQLLTRAIHQLEDDMRAVLILRDIQQMDYEQIASVLAVPVGTVKSRLFRARLSLRKQLNVAARQAAESPSIAGNGRPVVWAAAWTGNRGGHE